MEKIDLYFSANGLPKVHMLGVTDPFLSLYAVDPFNKSITRVAQSEVINDTLDPKWTKQITVDFSFELTQEMIVKIYHCEKGHPVTGEYTCFNFNLVSNDYKTIR